MCLALRPALQQTPEKLGREELRSYLIYLLDERKVALGTYKQALAALRFLYRWVLNRGDVVQDIRGPREGRRLPVVLSFDEVHRFFAAIPSFKHRTLLMLAYAAGLRVAEAAKVRLSDIDSERMVIRVVQGKRKKDRYTILSPLLRFQQFAAPGPRFGLGGPRPLAFGNVLRRRNE